MLIQYYCFWTRSSLLSQIRNEMAPPLNLGSRARKWSFSRKLQEVPKEFDWQLSERWNDFLRQ